MQNFFADRQFVRNLSRDEHSAHGVADRRHFAGTRWPALTTLPVVVDVLRCSAYHAPNGPRYRPNHTGQKDQVHDRVKKSSHI